MVLEVVLAAQTALSQTVHASRVHERQPRAREHHGRCHLLLGVRDPRQYFGLTPKEISSVTKVPVTALRALQIKIES